GGLLAGTPVPEIELEIADDGEIVVTGPHVLKGYLDGKGDAETKFTGADGETIWHRTGDLGRLDTDGRLWLLGRVSAKIGDELCPFAVECALSFVEGVGRTAVLESEEDGQPVLFLEGNGEVGPILNQFGIHRIIPLKKIPVDRRHNAKVDYPALRKILANFE
ncbi:MAG: AMP-binding protein, partial [Verrucomicrobiales bacterium]|nr:AMP-binding protein [Verrucomicrobiales bacterium]